MDKVTSTKIFAVIFTLVYLGMTWLLFDAFVLGDGADARWQRALVLYNPLVSVGFSAIGVLLGAKVEAVRTERVKTAAAEAKSDIEKSRAAVAAGDTGGGAPNLLQAAITRLDQAQKI